MLYDQLLSYIYIYDVSSLAAFHEKFQCNVKDILETQSSWKWIIYRDLHEHMQYIDFSCALKDSFSLCSGISGWFGSSWKINPARDNHLLHGILSMVSFTTLFRLILQCSLIFKHSRIHRWFNLGVIRNIEKLAIHMYWK